MDLSRVGLGNVTASDDHVHSVPHGGKILARGQSGEEGTANGIQDGEIGKLERGCDGKFEGVRKCLSISVGIVIRHFARLRPADRNQSF